jgi:signal transduction histidine kinase
VNQPRIRSKIFTTMIIVVAIPVVILSLMLAVLSDRNDDLRRLDRFRYAQSYLSALIEDRNRLVIARTALVSEDPRLLAALEDPSTMHQKILLLMAEYGLDGHILSSASDTGSLHMLDQSISRPASGLSAPAQPVVSPTAILFFHSELLRPGDYRLTGIGSIKRSELEVLRAGIGAEVDIILRGDAMGTRIMTTSRDGFGRNRAGSPIEPPLDSSPAPDPYPDQDLPLGPERRYKTNTGQERTARLMALPPILEPLYTASISFPHSEKAISEVAVYLIASALITISLALLASHLLARQLVDPIQTLLHGIDNLSIAIDAEDEFRPLPLPAKDEIGELTEAYNRMGVRLQSAYASLTSRNEALKELDSIKDQFLATTSRELRAPLNTIIALAESMAAVASPDSIQDQNLRSIANTGRKLYGMVNDILDYTRLEHSDIVLSTRTFELKPMVDSVLRFCSSIKRPETELLNVVEPGRLIHGDEARLEQVLYKLVGRAIQSATNGTITVRSWEEESILQISVTRSGDTTGTRNSTTQAEVLSRASLVSQPGLPDLDLGIATHLVGLHGGELEVKEDEGWTAIIRMSAQVPEDPITSA